MEQLFVIAAWTAYAIFFVAPLIQVARICRRKSSEDISLVYLSLLTFAMIILVPQMLVTNDPSLYVGHIGTMLANAAVLVTALCYRKKAPKI